MEKFEVGKTYEAIRGYNYHFPVTVVRKTDKTVTFKLGDEMQRYFNFGPEVRRRCKVVNDIESATLSGNCAHSYDNWVVYSNCVTQ